MVFFGGILPGKKTTGKRGRWWCFVSRLQLEILVDGSMVGFIIPEVMDHNVGIAKINHPFLMVHTCLYHPFMVIRGVVYYC